MTVIRDTGPRDLRRCALLDRQLAVLIRDGAVGGKIWPDSPTTRGYPIDPADVARLTPLGHPTINLDGRYRTTNRPPVTGLRPLRIK